MKERKGKKFKGNKGRLKKLGESTQMQMGNIAISKVALQSEPFLKPIEESHCDIAI